MILSTTKLLLVDDDEFVRGALTRALNQSGAFQVVPARDGEDALRILERERVDAVLTDLQMPKMDGLTMLGHLFERGIHLPVAVMTGQAIAPDLTRRLHDYGIAATFTKPVDVGTLADELQRSLDPEAVGRIKGITLFGLLQLLEVERKTALAVVRASSNEGRLYFEDGKLQHAHIGRVSGVEAAFEILGWADPTVELFYRRRTRQRTVTVPLQHVLMEAVRLQDERGLGDGRGTSDNAAATALSADAGRDTADPFAPALPQPAAPVARTAVDEALAAALAIDGAIGAALVHASSGMSLGDVGDGTGFSMELAAAAATDLVRAELKAMAMLRLDDTIEDIMVTLGKQYHLVAFVGRAHDVFLYLVLDRSRTNLGMARHQMARIARHLVV